MRKSIQQFDISDSLATLKSDQRHQYWHSNRKFYKITIKLSLKLTKDLVDTVSQKKAT